MKDGFAQYDDGDLRAELNGKPGVDPGACHGGLTVGRFQGRVDAVQLGVLGEGGRIVVNVYVSPETARRLAPLLVQAAAGWEDPELPGEGSGRQ